MATQEQLAELKDATIQAAFSSLTQFSCELSNGKGLILTASGTADAPAVDISVVSREELPREMDAVCKVDWSWITSSSISQFGKAPSAVRLTLTPAGPLTISAQVWQGKPFLAFQPFRPAK